MRAGPLSPGRPESPTARAQWTKVMGGYSGFARMPPSVTVAGQHRTLTGLPPHAPRA
jgi:hypothetical protein